MAIFNGKEILLAGLKGEPGVSPHVGQNGNWFVGDKDTGVAAGAMTEADKQAFKDAILEELGGGGGVSSWNDLTDKPFDDGEHIYIETSNVSTDTTVDTGNGFLVHVTDTTLPKASLIGATVTAHFPDGSSQSVVITEADILCEYDGGIVLLMMDMVLVWVCFRSGEHSATVNGETVTVEVPKAGIYVGDFLLSELSAMEFLCPTKCLDAKYLPMDAIKAVVDDYINEALGGDY